MTVRTHDATSDTGTGSESALAADAVGLPDRSIVAAVDVGGTTVKGVLWDLRMGGLARSVRAANAQAGPEAVVDSIDQVIADLLSADESRAVDGIGVVVPGLVNERDGIAVWAGNLRWRDLALRDRLAERFRLTVTLGKDSIAAGLAEFLLGAGHGSTHGLFVPIGTGIGGAVIIDGQPFPGSRHRAGEIGHTVVRPGGPQCACGQLGCLESIASGSALERAYREQAGESLPLATILERAKNGDPVSSWIWQDACDALADALISAAILLDLDTVVLGGGVAGAGDFLLEPVSERIVRLFPWTDPPTVKVARLGGDAGVIGAALLAWRGLGLSTIAIADSAPKWFP